MACVGVAGTRTAGLTALDVTFRERAAAHGLSLRQLRSEIENPFGNFARIGHGSSYGYNSRKNTVLPPCSHAVFTSMGCARTFFFFDRAAGVGYHARQREVILASLEGRDPTLFVFRV